MSSSSADRSRLFHAIVVVGLSFTTSACGGATTEANAGNDARASNADAPESGGGAESGTDAAPGVDASSEQGLSFPTPDASVDATGADGGNVCPPWPCYV